ncbi:MAG: hypothetical protein MI757_12010 [Pirellulales bacterium]|nr:hypothetical protein [Pirellulales bacterium]
MKDNVNTSDFDSIDAAMRGEGVDAALAALVERLRARKQYHQLLDARLMQSRRELDLPVVLTELEKLPEVTRAELEDKYLAVCDEVGWLLLDDGKVRDAWHYLRTSSDRAKVAAALKDIEPNDENVEELIDVALHEGVAPGDGFRMMLKHYGTCPAVTSLETELGQQSPESRQEIVRILVSHMHAELMENCVSHVEQEKGTRPTATTLGELLSQHPWLTSEGSYHTDTSHLAATVRFCRYLENSEENKPTLALAFDLTRYGGTLDHEYQFESESPFTDTYASHGLFYAAQLGEQAEEAVDYFRNAAEECDVEMMGAFAVETYIVLLARLGRHEDAIRATIEMIPQGVHTTGFAPSLLELSRDADDYAQMLDACRKRADLVAFTAALAESAERADSPPA